MQQSSRVLQGPLLLLLLLLSLEVYDATALYHTSSQMLHWFSHCAAKRPDILRFRELHERHTGTHIPVATITAGLQNQQQQHSKPVVMFVFGEHAREVITSEVGIWLARMLVDPNSSVYEWPELAAAFQRAGIDATGRSTTNATSSSSTSPDRTTVDLQQQQQQDWATIARQWIQQLLEKLEVVIIPIEALDSRRQVEAGQLCLRKTASNVDLNRNWPYAWKQEAATDEQYGGPGPLSEPQSRLMKHLFDNMSGRLLGYVNVHSGEWALYTPWDSKQAYGPGLPADLPDLVGKVGRLCDCKAGPAGAVSGYLAFGTSMDYLYVHKRVPYPLTVEVYGGNNIGKLTPGNSNKELIAWPVVTKAGSPTTAAADFQRRRLHQQQHKQQRDEGDERDWGVWSRLRSLFQQQQQPTEQQLGVQQRRRRHWQRRRRSRGGLDESSLPLLPNISAATTATSTPPAVVEAGAVAAVMESGAVTAATATATVQKPQAAGSGSFSAGAYLEQLKQLAKQQLQQQDGHLPAASSRSSSASISVSSLHEPLEHGAQMQLQAADAILGLAAAAQPHLRSCFDAFNPTSEAEYRRVVADWLAASIIMMKHMADGEVGKRMAVDVAAAAGGASVNGNGSSISFRSPVISSNSSSTRDLLAGHC